MLYYYQIAILDYYYKKTNNELNLKLKNETYLIIMIGLPASGKSHLSKMIKNIHKNLNFQIINQDGLVTKVNLINYWGMYW